MLSKIFCRPSDMDGRTRVGITGGIGSGKSYVCRLLKEEGFPVFDTDTSAREEMLHNELLRSRLRALVSPDVFRADGALNKPVIRKFLHSSPQNAALFDGEVHPCVRTRWREWAESQASPVVFMECALLYEASFHTEVDFCLLVSAPEDLRVRRVMQRDGIPEATVRKWIGMQLSEEEKMRCADFVICNDGKRDLMSQIRDVLEVIQGRGK